MAKFFDDIGKDSSDLLSKDLPSSGTAKVNIETKNDSGVTIAAAARRYVKGKDALVEATIEPTVDLAKQNIEVKGVLSTAGTYSGTFTYKDLGMKGSKVSATSTHSDVATTAGGGFSFKNDLVAVKANAAYPVRDDRDKLSPSVDATVAATYEKKAFAGVTASYTHSREKIPAVLLWGLKLGFEQAEYQGNLSVKNATKDNKDQLIIGAGWFHKISDALKLAASAAFDTKQVTGPTVSVGSEYKFDALTSYKERLTVQMHPDSNKEADVRLAFAIKQLFTKNASASFGADLNARALIGQNSGDDHTFGVELKFF